MEKTHPRVPPLSEGPRLATTLSAGLSGGVNMFELRRSTTPVPRFRVVILMVRFAEQATLEQPARRLIFKGTVDGRIFVLDSSPFCHRRRESSSSKPARSDWSLCV